MRLGNWRYAYASVKGTSHAFNDTPCQDTSSCCILTTKQLDEVLLSIASDGAGSAKKAERGSKLACDTFIKQAVAYFESGCEVTDLTVERVKSWLQEVINELYLQAEGEGLSVREFAC